MPVEYPRNYDPFLVLELHRLFPLLFQQLTKLIGEGKDPPLALSACALLEVLGL
jgi:hypothetical protein